MIEEPKRVFERFRLKGTSNSRELEMHINIVKRGLVGLSVALIAASSLASPALAAVQHARYEHHHAPIHHRYTRHPTYGGWLFGQPNAYASGSYDYKNPYGTRCVEDLGYGRYDYCD